MSRTAAPAASMTARAAPTALRLHRRTGFVRGPTFGAAQPRLTALEESGPASPHWCKSASCCMDGPPGSHCGGSEGPLSARTVDSLPGLQLQGSCPAAAPAGTTARTGPTTVVRRAASATWTLAPASVAPAPSVSQGRVRRAARPSTSARRRRGSAARPSTTSWTWPAASSALPPCRCRPSAASCRHRAAQPVSRTRAAPSCVVGPTASIADARAPGCRVRGGPLPTMPPTACGAAPATAVAGAPGAR